ncbi:unnamed protein product, partial [Timema podura]|nr:unnamed protein product [Timema podura]
PLTDIWLLQGSDRATLESIVDSLQQGLLEVAGARHSGSGPTQGSLVLTQQQLQQLHHFQSHHLSQQQSASVGGVRQHAVTFTLPSHT